MSFANVSEKTRFVEDLTAFLESQYNRIAYFQEDISSNNMNYDRHFTTSNRFEFQLAHAFVRFSGARFGIEGTNSELYELDVISMVSGELKENVITIIECLGKQITRKSVITLK